MTNYDRMRNASEDEMASAIAILMAYVSTDDIDDWNSLALSRDMYKKWLLDVWMKKDFGSEKEKK